MSIKPLDMQVMLPKIQEVANSRNVDHKRSELAQQQVAQTVQNTANKETKNVIKTNEKEKTYSQSDAKQQGKNTYGYSRKKKNKKSTEKDKSLKKRNSIDIKI